MNEIMQLAVLINILTATIRLATPLLLASLGEMVTERSGVMNLGVEGTMLVGAFIGFLVANQTGSNELALIAAMLAGALTSLLTAFLVVTLKVEQVVTGLAINLLAVGITLFWYRIVYAGFSSAEIPTIDVMKPISVPILYEIPIIGAIFFNQRLITYIAFLSVPLLWLFIYHTKFGLLLRGLGENPRALDRKGINVYLTQYLAVIFGGMMAGIGGSFLTLGSSIRFIPEITAGRGWLAIVIVIAGNWHPWRILAMTFLFAFLDAFQLQLQGIGIKVQYQLLLMLPYVFAILAMMGSRLRSTAPKHLGKPYIRG